MSAQARPTFFCSRPNGDLTPLIAIDDLPTHVYVRGVPRSLSADETHGMTSCGMVLPRSEPYVVDGPAGTQVSLHAIAHKKLADELKIVLTNVMRDPNVPPHHRQAVGTMMTAVMETPYFLNKGTNDNQAATVSGNATSTAMVPVNSANNALVPVQAPGQAHGNFSHGQAQGHTGHGKGNPFNKKMYCSYWIRHGECDYQQQGCMFKHEMPIDPVMLEKLGLRDIPRWYREKYGMTSMVGHPTLGQLANAPAANAPAIESGTTVKAIEYARNDRTPVPQFDQAGHHPRLNGRWRGSRGGGHGGRSRNNNWNRNAHHRHAGHHQQNNTWYEVAHPHRAAPTGPVSRAPVAPGPVAHVPVSHAPVGPAPVARGPVAPGVPFPGFVVTGPVHLGPVAPGTVHPGPVVSGPVYSGPVVSGPVHPAPVVTGPVHPAPVAPGPVDPATPRPATAVAQQRTEADWTQVTPTRKNYLRPDSVISTSTDTSFSAAQTGTTSTWDFLTAGMAPPRGSDARPVQHLLDDTDVPPAPAKPVKRSFNFGQDGNPVAKDLGKAADKTSLSALTHLVAESDPIGPNELLLNFGAIGGPVESPHSGQSVGGIPVSAGQETNLSSTGFGGMTAQKPAAM